jgi:hypothetical protein
MAHNTRTQLDAVWNNGGAEGYQPSSADLESLDAKLFAAVNGDQGGTWAPAAPIIFGNVANNLAPSITIGPSIVCYGGSIKTAAGSRIIYDDTAYPLLGASHPGRQRTIVTSCMHRKSSPPYHWICVPQSMSIQSIGLTVQCSAVTYRAPPLASDMYTYDPLAWLFRIPPQIPNATFLEQPSFVLPLRVHDGARLARVTLKFRVPNIRTKLPVTLPRMRVVRVDGSGNVVPMKLTADGSGFVSPTAPTSPEAWSNSGNVQSIVYACDQNNTIDTSQYYYELQVIEEVGTSASIRVAECDGVLVVEKKLDVVVASTANVTLSGTQTVDGYTTSTTGERVLVKDQTDSTANGIYLVNNATTWQRAPDCATLSPDFTPNFIVEVAGGTLNKHTVWQLVGPTNKQTVNNGVSFRRRKPTGNVYHAAVCDFDQILDMRPQ